MKKIIFVISFLLIGAFATPVFSEVLVKEEQVIYLLHFGRGENEKAVNLMDFHGFIAKELAPYMAEGLTIIEAKGQWTSPKFGLTRENTTVVEVVTTASEEVEQKLNDISEKYVKQFKAAQVSVFITKIPQVTSVLIY